MENVPTSVIVIWWIALIITVLVVLPLAVYLLNRTLRAARQIEHYLARARQSGAGIAANTVATEQQLNRTLNLAPGLLEPAAGIERGSEELTRTLVGRLEGGER
jgi:hypothetical protein